MRETSSRGKRASKDKYTRGSFSLLQTHPAQEQEKKAQTAVEQWNWQVHETALHTAIQTEGTLALGNSEPLLKVTSSEITHKAQEQLRQKPDVRKTK